MVTVQYENTVVRGDEPAGRLMFVLVTSKPAEEPFTVQVCTMELNETDGLSVSDGSATGYLPFAIVYVCGCVCEY